MNENQKLREALRKLYDACISNEVTTKELSFAVAVLSLPTQAEPALIPSSGLAALAIEWTERRYGIASQEQAQQPNGHIKSPYSVSEIKTKIESGDYNAEMLLQHAMFNLEQQPAAQEPVGTLVSDEYDGHRFIPTGDDWPFDVPLYTTPQPAPASKKD